MDALVGCSVAVLLGCSAAGAGLAALTALGLRDRLPRLELWPTAVTVGVGVLGWVMFFPGVMGFLNRPTIGVIVAVGLCGWAPIVRGASLSPNGGNTWPSNQPIALMLLAVLAISLGFDLTAAFAPPADADSLAYHFALPKQFLAAGRVEFIPRAVDGAPPLLIHMTYTMALGLGGETALTLWACWLGWLPAWLLYAFARRFVAPNWALILAIVFLTTPAIVYSGNAGHMEVKLGAFALVAAAAAADCIRTGNIRYAILAGMAAGFFLAAKYNGFIFIGAVGLALLPQRLWLRCGLSYAAAVMAVAWQWYTWDYINSGDPLFPLLYNWLGAKDGMWSPEMATVFAAENFTEEAPAPHNLLWLFAYPFVATFSGLPQWESGRTGLGPFAVLVLPFAIAGLWHRRKIAHPLFTVGLIAAIFYVVWYLSGTSQRVRHLTALYPLILVCLGVAAARFTDTSRTAAPLAAGIVLTVLVQLGGQGIFALNYMRHWISGESREAFLERNVARYGPVPWINSHLSSSDRLLLTERQLVYHIDIPVYTAQSRFQYLVDLLPGESNPRRFAAELARLGITHILMLPSLDDARHGKHHIWTNEITAFVSVMVDAGCAQVLHTAQAVGMTSRTVPALDMGTISADIIAVQPNSCRLNEGAAPPISR